MKKPTLYARKRRAPERREYNAAEWLNVIQRCAGYSTDAPAGSWLGTGTNQANKVFPCAVGTRTAWALRPLSAGVCWCASLGARSPRKISACTPRRSARAPVRAMAALSHIRGDQRAPLWLSSASTPS